MKLTKKDRKKLEDALAQMQKGYRAMIAEDLVFARPGHKRATEIKIWNEKGELVRTEPCAPNYGPREFVNREGEILESFRKEGSELEYISNGITALRNILNENEKVIYRGPLSEAMPW